MTSCTTEVCILQSIKSVIKEEQEDGKQEDGEEEEKREWGGVNKSKKERNLNIWIYLTQVT